MGRQTGILAACLLWAAVSSSAIALDAHKTALAVAQRAAKAFENGEMAAAAQLYHDAYRTDAAEPNYLYGAARAAQSARDIAHAEADYREFVALPNAEPARVQKAKQYLADLLMIRVDAKVAEADRALSRGDTVLAPPLYLEAYGLAPERHELLLRAALAEREAGETNAAVSHLLAFVRDAPADASGRATAESLLRSLDKSGAVKNPTATPQTAKPGVATASAADKLFATAMEAWRGGRSYDAPLHKAMEADPTHPAAHLLNGLLSRQTDATGASKSIAIAVQNRARLTPFQAALLDATEPYWREPNDVVAWANQMTQLVKQFPNEPEGWFFHGVSRLFSNRANEADASFTECSKIAPDFVPADGYRSRSHA